MSKEVFVRDGFYAVHLFRDNSSCSSPVGCWAFGLEPTEGEEVVWLSQKGALELIEILEEALERVATVGEMN